MYIILSAKGVNYKFSVVTPLNGSDCPSWKNGEQTKAEAKYECIPFFMNKKKIKKIHEPCGHEPADIESSTSWMLIIKT